MQGFVCVCVLLCLWLGLAVSQNDAIFATPAVTPVTPAPTSTPVTLAPELTSESPATLAPEQPTLSPPICNEPGYDLDPLAR